MIRQFNTNIKETGMVLGQIFIPVIQKVMPVVNGVTIAIKRMLVSFARLMGVKIDFDAFGQNGYQDTTDGLEDMADGYNDVAKAAKNAQRVFVDLTNLIILVLARIKAVLPLAQVIRLTSRTRLLRLRKNMKKYGTMPSIRWRIKLRCGLIK